MKRKKHKLGWFTISQWKKEETWLRQQHQNGWAFVHFAMPCFYLFEECEPEDMVYQLDYHQDGAKGNPHYVQMFRDCGWEYLMEAMGYCYFRKPASQMKEPEEIFCDDQSRLDMIRRVFKGRMVPLLLIFFCAIVPQLFSTYHRAIHEGVLRGVFYCLAAMFILYLVVFIRFAATYWALRKNGRP